ncbi:MAG: hypothetical protein HKN17_02615 [Rhodothermales bacterium]|nr:hypothetical protein [Rhodothermales bacterium]
MPLSLGTGSAEATLVRNWPTGTTSIHAGLMTQDASQATQISRVRESRGFAGLGWRSTLSEASRLNLDARVSHPVDAPLDPSTASSAVLLELTSRFGHIGLSGGITVSSERRAPLSSLSELAAAGFDAGDLGPRIFPAPLRTRERIAETHVRIESGGSDPATPTGQATGVTRWLELRLRRSQGLTILDTPITRIRDVSSTSEPRYVSGISGSAWQVMAGVAWRPPGGQTRRPGGLRVQMSAYAGGSSTQSDVYRTWKSGPPRYAAQIDVGWSAKRIGLDVSSRIEGPGRWRMYARTPSAYRPVRTRIDAAVWKRIGGETALLTLGIRNLLDTPYLIHPAGIDEQLSVRAGMTVRFNRTMP